MAVKASYPAYRNTDLPWLGQIPAHWDIERLKWTIEYCQNGAWGDEPNGIDDVACVRVADFDRIKFRVNFPIPTIRALPKVERRNKSLKKGDLLLEKSGGGDLQPVGFVVLYDSDEPAICSNFVARMPIRENYDPNFLCYLHAALYAGKINTQSIKQNTGIQNIDSVAYLDEKVPLPPVSEQRTIAAYLDHQTAKIDALIAKKRRLLDLLAEQRSALISRAVTKGLNPNVPLKDSGVAWLGQVPGHWEVNKIKYVAQLESGHTPRKSIPEYWENCTIPWVSLNDVGYIREHEFISETVNLISELGLAHSSARMLPKGTVILSRDASVGFCAILSQPMATSQHFVNWICSRKLFNEYLLLVLKWAMQQELKKLTMGSTVLTIGLPDVKSFTIPVPPIEEQEKIVLYVKTKKEYLDSIIAKTEKMIDRLREYRAALISSAVTGKIDVTQVKQEGV